MRHEPARRPVRRAAPSLDRPDPAAPDPTDPADPRDIPRSERSSDPRHRSLPARVSIHMFVVSIALVVPLVLSACSGSASSAPSSSPAASTGAGGSASPAGSGAVESNPATGPIETAEQAAAVVLALDPRFSAIKPKDPDLIGQAAWYTVDAGPGDSWTVQVRIGWGDCPSGCINEHVWTYEVARDGTATQLNETGPDVPSDAIPQS